MQTISFINASHNAEMCTSMALAGYSMDCGYANGYVAVPPGHPWHGKHYDDLDNIDVHGGLTYSESTPCDVMDNGMSGVSYIDGGDEIPDGWWVLGFDTCHCYDTLDSWPREAVIAETRRLQQQAEAAAAAKNERD